MRWVTVPGRDADEFAWLTFEQSGVVTTAQAVGALGRGKVRGRVRSGCWRRICRGILLTGNGELTRPQQLWVAVLACGPRARLAGGTAVAEFGVRGLRLEPLDVLVPGNNGRHTRLPRLPPDMPGVRVHRTIVLPAGHCQLGRPPRTSIGRSVLDAAAWARTDDEARTVLTSACQQRRVTVPELRGTLAVLTRLPRRRLITTTLGDIEGGAEALSEIDLLALCRRYGLPQPTLQERRTDAAGRTRYLDAYWREWRVHVEVDGGHHLDVRHWAADMLRQNEVWIRGDRILRFPAWLVRTRPSQVADQIRAALHASGWRPARRPQSSPPPTRR